jgi:DNA-damage-inducible protein D
MKEDSSLNKYFEEAKHIAIHSAIEFWHARDLMPLLGYSSWQSFEEVIQRAARAAMNSGESVDNHFKRAPKMVKIGSNANREVAD